MNNSSLLKLTLILMNNIFAVFRSSFISRNNDNLAEHHREQGVIRILCLNYMKAIPCVVSGV